MASVSESAPIGAVVLAAGLANRMGQPKVLLPWGDGETILGHILTELAQAGAAHTLVVTGHLADNVRAVAQQHGAAAVHNPDYAAGEMLSSLQTGLRALPMSVTAALVVLGDQPRLQASIVKQVIERYQAGRASIVAPSYQMRRGHPILIDRALWNEILTLPENKVLRDVINAHKAEIAYVSVDTDSVLQDVDTPQEYEEEKRRAGLN